jgi:hypothetical protein
MSKYNYRLVAKTIDGKVKLGGRTCHETKSMAGRLLQSPTVISVLVADVTGRRYFYMVKDFQGHIISEKTENIPSRLALFG